MTDKGDKTLSAFLQIASLKDGEYICHFTSLSTALEKILETGKLGRNRDRYVCPRYP